MQTTLGARLTRAGLWLTLLGGPLLYCLLPLLVIIAVAGTPVDYSDIYIAGQVVVPQGDIPLLTKYSLFRAGAAFLCIAWPVLLSATASYGLLVACSCLVHRRWLAKCFRPVRSSWLLGSRLIGLLVAAYVVGCAVHLLLPDVVFHPDALFRHTAHEAPNLLQVELAREEYWWPYSKPSAQALHGYTIYSPLYMAELAFQSIKASCVKLGALLAALLFYQRYSRRFSQSPTKSAQFI